jgi:NAD(P)-dependent dehydrogenase (short-subunit alcohol dehydrogenase family)
MGAAYVDVSKLFSVEGKVALVTGGSRGIGEMIARGLAGAGARVYVSSRKAEACQRLADELTDDGGEAIPLPADLSRPEECRRLAEELARREPRLHILVNNAGATWGAPLEDYPLDGWDKVMNVNVRGVFLLTQALADRLRAAGSAEDPARVINIGSVDGLRSPQMESYAYSASKAAVHHLTRHLGWRLTPDHVTVNAIAPGLFPSKMTAFMFEGSTDQEEAIGRGIPRGRVGQPEDIAGTVIWLASRAGAYVTGAVVPVDGGAVTLR